MSFIDARLSDQVRLGSFTGGPEWSTRITALASGAENRNGQWAMPHHRFSADYAQLDPTEQQVVLAAFWAARGALHTFRFKDWNDYKVINQSLGSGDGTATPRQLVKTYTFGATSYSRTLTLPLDETIAVTANGTPLAVTVSETTGLITPAGTWPSGQAIVVTYCEFDVRVRFGADYYPFQLAAQHVNTCVVDLLEK